MKRYTLYRFPSFNGSPRHFRFKFFAWLAAKFGPPCFVYELDDNKTGRYVAYWA